MRRFLPILFLGLVAAKGGKKPAEPAPAPAPAATVPAEPAPPVEEPAPPAPPAGPTRNADFSVTLTYAGGSTKAGKVKAVERTVDFQGDEGWTQEDSSLRLSVELSGTEKQVAWKDVKSITVVPGKMPDEVDCTYSSDFTPWMYDCTIRTTTTVTLKDGTKGAVTNRHHWRFTFEDGEQVELQVYKYSVREQDERTVEFGDEATENYALYTKLQDKLRNDLKTVILKSVSVQ